MDIEGTGFIIGLIGAVWMKSSMNLIKNYKSRPELKMIGRDAKTPRSPPLSGVFSWCSSDLG